MLERHIIALNDEVLNFMVTSQFWGEDREYTNVYVDGSMQDSTPSLANALEIHQFLLSHWCYVSHKTRSWNSACTFFDNCTIFIEIWNKL